ncbi:MAG: arginine--tRNA ligase, partial [Chitinispirillaceae bacterium]|nr:arginine--tRNA ligase [Chitinispirillaceae bacterium]
LAYIKEGDNKTPESTGIKGDHFVGNYYVLFNKRVEEEPSWNDEAQTLLVAWEAGDEKIRSLWSKMNRWALNGFAETYSLFGIKFDKEYYESEIYTLGKEIVMDGLQRNIFSKREDGAVIIDLSSENLGEKVLLRADGTAVYIVQDLYLALLKDKDFSYDKSIYVVGNEQEYHFSVLKAILKKLGYSVADKIYHLSYGMVELPEGKMKSREGKVVDADDLILETKNLAAEEVRSRYNLEEEEVEKRSLKIALAAIKYQLLRTDITKNILFDPKKAINFEGDTGPYILYTYARASSILRKAKRAIDLPTESIDFSEKLTSSEISLLKKVDFFPDAVILAYNKLSPSVIANYTFELCQIFNEFYHSVQVIGSKNEPLRLKLVYTIQGILKKCIWLLGFEEIEEM